MWPPVEQCAGADHVGLLGEGDAAIADRLVEALDGREATISERLVDEHPKVLGWLQLGTVGGLEDEADTIGHGQVLWAVPAGIVELKHDALVGSSADRLGKIGENEFEHLLADSVGDVPHCLARRRLDEGRRGLEFFLSVARSSSVAAAGCRGRGCWIE